MRILKARAALLSDFEVLKVLKEMEFDQKNRVKLASQITQIDDDSDVQDQNALTAKGEEDDVWLSNIPENLRTVQYETISSLSQTSRPCAHQEADNIVAFLDELRVRGYSITDSEAKRGALGLNRSERLQIVNHAPQSVVELHTLVEELEERFHPHQIQEIISLVQTYLPIHPTTEVNTYAAQGAQDDPGAINGAAHLANAEAPEHISQFTGELEAAAELGGSNSGGLARVPEDGAEREAANLDYEEDPDVEMDEDDFVHEGLGGGGVEEAEADD
ncbi:related to RPC17 - RNA polymerase III subunit C17 [Melanopsichium pennsylvanicum]|uniref:DNA-directed RNA polymerase III subunit RPC9 n=2 Tax=Melanopsichium pennsylvanicum TaxID=63383 RepID=A0AAJ5C4B7_9BASI|nr:dna-directed rna polymerase iii subunit [Melanopsichium pennsylvanicum 4]SNX83309.1 related to RPC17 - RNA polymerase III subunit C17 [Melanopsichium pennsylvanicum]